MGHAIRPSRSTHPDRKRHLSFRVRVTQRSAATVRDTNPVEPGKRGEPERPVHDRERIGSRDPSRADRARRRSTSGRSPAPPVPASTRSRSVASPRSSPSPARSDSHPRHAAARASSRLEGVVFLNDALTGLPRHRDVRATPRATAASERPQRNREVRATRAQRCFERSLGTPTSEQPPGDRQRIPGSPITQGRSSRDVDPGRLDRERAAQSPSYRLKITAPLWPPRPMLFESA